jgi:hypothetical protein
VAALVMIQGHAYHGWVAAEHRDTVGYQLTRVLGTLPLPAFLVLAGAAVTWRVHAAATRGESAVAVRKRVLTRGLQIVLWGYAASILYALLDGARSLETVLRADVLHVIGLGIATLALLGIRPRFGSPHDTPPAPHRLGLAALVLGLAVTLLCPWLTQLTRDLPGPGRYLVALFSEVRGITRMPFVPLFAWMGVGVGAALWMLGSFRHATQHSDPTSRWATRMGAHPRTLLGMATLATAVAFSAGSLTHVFTTSAGIPLTRAHPIVWLNVVDLAARGVLLLAFGALLTPLLPQRAQSLLIRLGRGSLVAYVFHIPFCYGALAGPFAGTVDMTAATAGVPLLMAASFAAVWFRDQALDAWRTRRARPSTAELAS